MIKYFKFYLLFFFLIFTNINAENKNIVFIDIDYLLNNSDLGKEALKRIDDIKVKNLSNLKEKEKILLNKEKEIKKKQNIISKEELKKEVDQLKVQINNFKKEKNSLFESSEKMKVEELNKILNKINIIVKEYMSNNSVDLVLNKKNIFIGKVSSDITEIILNEINSKK